ncbi:hypothetical protein HYDPIDRAFT_99027 [Hydnomerulius pinastri MD-312]|uniref:Phytochrome n=1 Tax=Hydnomerulius pinastri MD-312 TaxID=994086 RepID=A0A0C9V4D1_9AGAM|nr:hypothetical protein HYDPIDRAFT_99027 [Hydnomerulius pinastri MD-312]
MRESCADSTYEPSDIKHPSQFSEVAASAFSDPTYLIPPTNSDGISQLPLNPSELGIVHLPPLPPSPSTTASEKVSSPGSSAVNAGALQRSAAPEAQKPVDHIDAASNQSLLSFNPSKTQSGSEPEQWTTTRYSHVEDEHGHHVVTGREGVLTKCEDEPIRTPGAVQGFGVLIAVEDNEEAGLLVVRQVSENARDILGLSPEYLFSLQCFTDTLPEAQADILWDNIQFLNEPQVTTEAQENSPHVFLLSGWGEPGSGTSTDTRGPNGGRSWTCWCAVHRPHVSDSGPADSALIILEFELERDAINPLYPITSATSTGSPSPESTAGTDSTGDSGDTLVSTDPGAGSTITAVSKSDQLQLTFAPEDDDDDWKPTTEDIIENTTNCAKPIPALERLRRTTSVAAQPAAAADPNSRSRRQGGRRRATNSPGVGMMDVFSVMAQINEQLGATADLETCLKVTVGIIKDLSQFHRVMVYQFDEVWNGEVVAELVDRSQSNDLYKGLHFPAADIPAQARQLYAINTVRILYNRSQPTARIVVRSKSDLEVPLNMTHSYLRAMSPIHLKYLENMGVQASFSVSVMAFGSLWGLISCHTYGHHGMRVSFPVRQMLRLLSQTISRNIERLSYARRLQIRKLINPIPHEHYSTGYVVSSADDLLALFDADYGILVIGEGAKILGPNFHGQEILVMAEYLRLKHFDAIQVSQAVIQDYPDLRLSTGLAVIAGLLYVPLSSGGKDFIALLRKGQPRNVRWAGRPNKDTMGSLQPRKSFKTWSETVAGRSRAWTEEELETAGVLSLMYSKFIDVWRQKESALQMTNLTNILLSNASHEVRTPLNHIINYLEMAMNGPLDVETRENLSRSHTASKASYLPSSAPNLLFTINDLLDLTRVESGGETSLNEPFNLRSAIEESIRIYQNEATRRGIEFVVNVKEGPKGVIGDLKKIKTVVANLTANALKYTTKGKVSVQCCIFDEPEGLRDPSQTAVEIVVSDTGCGIPSDKLESIFREFEQVESSEAKSLGTPGVGLGLAVVARIVEQLGGQLRVDSQIDVGSRFSFLIPLELSKSSSDGSSSAKTRSISSIKSRSQACSKASGLQELKNLAESLTANHMDSPTRTRRSSADVAEQATAALSEASPDSYPTTQRRREDPPEPPSLSSLAITSAHSPSLAARTQSDSDIPRPISSPDGKLRALIVEDNDVNRKLLAKRLEKDGHIVLWSTNGQEGLEMIESDREFDCILMDIQMPILNGFECTERIRELEKKSPKPPSEGRLSLRLNSRIPIFAVSASLFERQLAELIAYGLDGWILKPIDFARLRVLLKGITDPSQRKRDVYRPGCNWELGGWFQ